MNYGRSGKKDSPFHCLSRQAASPEGPHNTMMGDYVSADQRLRDLQEKREGYYSAGKPVPEDIWKQEGRIYKSQEAWRKYSNEGGMTLEAEDLR